METTYYAIMEQVGAIFPKDKIQMAKGGATLLVMEARNTGKQDRELVVMFMNGEKHTFFCRKNKKVILWLNREKSPAAQDLELVD